MPAIDHPLVTIVVPCYGQAAYLDEALQSVYQQSYTHWECLIIDDGSPDNTAEIARQWASKDSRFALLQQANRGLSSARNLGLSKASGRYVQFLDADDLIEPEKLRHHVLHLSSGIDISIAGYRYFEHSDPSRELRIIGRNNFYPEVFLTRTDTADLVDVFKQRNPFAICSPLYRRELLERLGGFNESLQALEDWFLNLSCALAGATFEHFGYAPGTRCLIRLHDSSMMRDTNRMRAAYQVFLEHCADSPAYVQRFGRPASPMRNTRLSWLKHCLHRCTPPVIADVWRTLTT